MYFVSLSFDGKLPKYCLKHTIPKHMISQDIRLLPTEMIISIRPVKPLGGSIDASNSVFRSRLQTIRHLGLNGPLSRVGCNEQFNCFVVYMRLCRQSMEKFESKVALWVGESEPNHHTHSLRVNSSHLPDLNGFLVLIVLIETDSIDPKSSFLRWVS